MSASWNKMHKGLFWLSGMCGYLTTERFQLKGLLQASSPTSCSKHRQLQASIRLLCSTGVELSAGNSVRLENASLSGSLSQYSITAVGRLCLPPRWREVSLFGTCLFLFFSLEAFLKSGSVSSVTLSSLPQVAEQLNPFLAISFAC